MASVQVLWVQSVGLSPEAVLQPGEGAEACFCYG